MLAGGTQHRQRHRHRQRRLDRHRDRYPVRRGRSTCGRPSRLRSWSTSTTLPEPGGDFHFTLKITNTSVEPVVITQLRRLIRCRPRSSHAYLGTFLDVDASGRGPSRFPYTVNHTDAMTYGNTATVTVQDNEENTATAEADADGRGHRRPADRHARQERRRPTTMPEPGGVFNFTLTITNTSVEPVEITDSRRQPVPSGQRLCHTSGLPRVRCS